MSSDSPRLGAIGWVDLTVDDADGLRDFYGAVAGWSSQPHAMDGYADHVMTDAEGGAVAGVCHARGPNAGLPAQWLIYVTVADVAAACEAVVAHGGEVIRPPREGSQNMAVVRDPAGAAFALYQA